MKLRRKGIKLVLAMVLCLPGFSLAQNHEYLPDIVFKKCMDDSDGTTAKMIECENQAYDMWNDYLNRYYKELMSMLDPYSKSLLKNSEIAWLRYVNARLHFDTHVLATGGTMDQLNAIDEQRRLIKKRAIYLHDMIHDIRQTGS